MEKYDVLVVGAGPSGGQCAKLLTDKGYKVLVIDRVEDFSKNNFSSAATPLETLTTYNLPPLVIQSSWSKFEVWVNEDKKVWEQKELAGVVMDFAKLRSFLTSKCEVKFGTSYDGTIEAKVIVDATGPARAVIGESKSKYYLATGLEYVVKITSDDAKKFDREKTVWFLGKKWIDHGYCWIFNAGGNLLKIGACYYDSENPPAKNLKNRIDDLISYWELRDYKIVDEHGSTVKIFRAEKLYKDNIIAVGDAISCINPLGGEGIRHGFYSATVAADEIDQYLSGKISSFSNYEKRMKKYFGKKWALSLFLSQNIYQYIPDWLSKGLFNVFNSLTLKEFMEILFKYNFVRTGLLAHWKFVLEKFKGKSINKV